jgi:GT2 family glycosyltransferase
VGAISGAFFLMLRPDFEALGGLDEEYFLHVEDLDLCRRAYLAGGTVLFHPNAEAVHARSTSAAPRLAIERHKAAGFRRYFQKFARTWEEKLLAYAVTPLIEGTLIARARLSQRG